MDENNTKKLDKSGEFDKDENQLLEQENGEKDVENLKETILEELFKDSGGFGTFQIFVFIVF